MSEPSIKRVPTTLSKPSKPISSKKTSQISRQLVLEFLAKNRAAALATVNSEGHPHVATVYCLVNNDYSFYFVTRIEARKYINLVVRPSVAMTFMNEADMATVQLSGYARRVEDLNDEQAIFYKLMLLRHAESDWPLPPMKLFESGLSTELAVIEVQPSELTYACFKAHPDGPYKPYFTKII